MPCSLGAHSDAVGRGGAIARAAEHVGLLLGPMQRGAGNEIPDTMPGDLSCLLWWRRIITNRLSVIMQMASDSEKSAAGLAEILTNFFSALDIQAASQLLFHSTQTVKQVAISIHVKTLSCFCVFIHISFSDWLDVLHMLIVQRAHWCRR